MSCGEGETWRNLQSARYCFFLGVNVQVAYLQEYLVHPQREVPAILGVPCHYGIVLNVVAYPNASDWGHTVGVAEQPQGIHGWNASISIGQPLFA